MKRGDKNGVYIVDLKNDTTLWLYFVHEQANYMLGLGLIPDLPEHPKSIRYGHYQHDAIKPMFGISGDAAFQEARKLWCEHVETVLKQLNKVKHPYTSPFDGKVK